MKLIRLLNDVPEWAKLFLMHFIYAAGVVGVVITIVAAAKDHPDIGLKWLMLGCSLVCVIYALVRVWPTTSVTIYLAPRKKVKLIQGDLFEQNGILLIPVNNYFDMTTERDVIGPSVHYQFIKRYVEIPTNCIENINQKISSTLQTDGVTPKTVNNARQFPDNHDAYELGTTARLFENGKTFYLSVVSEFDDHNHIIPQPEKFGYIFQSILKNINCYRSGHDVYMPVIGSGLLNMPMDIEELIGFMLDNIKFSDYNSTVGCIYIVVRKEDMNRLSFRSIQNRKSSILNM